MFSGKTEEMIRRLRRLYWLEATKSERDFNNLLVKPMPVSYTHLDVYKRQAS